jgi:site-specific recombinase XerD
MKQVTGLNWLIIHLMYGTGMRVIECVRLRILDIRRNGVRTQISLILEAIVF